MESLWLQIVVPALVSIVTGYIVVALSYRDFNIKRGFYKWYKKHSYWEYYATELTKMRSQLNNLNEKLTKIQEINKN